MPAIPNTQKTMWQKCFCAGVLSLGVNSELSFSYLGNEGNRVNSLFQGRNHGKVWASLGILALILSVSFFNFAFTEIFLSQTGTALQAKGSAAGKSFETLGRWMKQFLPHPREHTLIPWSQNTSKNPQVLELDRKSVV